jgi:hypothetical protein
MSKYRYSDFTLGEEYELLEKLGGPEVVRKFLKGLLKFSLTEQELFDKSGRRIKLQNVHSAVCDPDKTFCVTQPTFFDYKDRFSRGFKHTGLDPGMSWEDFSRIADELIMQLKADNQLQELLNGPFLPIIIPKSKLTDIGAMTEELVKVARKSYKKNFSKLLSRRPFTNYRKNTLKEHVTVIKESRYSELLERIKEKSIVAIYFPTVLQGYSVDAQREQMSSLPEVLILSGSLDISMAFAMYPDILGRDGDTPVYDCSAVNWRSSEYSLRFYIRDGIAYFDHKKDLTAADGSSSGGLLYMG